MATDSSEAGYLAPSTAPPYDEALEDIFQAAIVGITGLPGRLVRPRWQPDPPNQPAFDVDWCAYGVTLADQQWNAFQHWDPEEGEAGAYVVEGTEVLHVTTSFYGPNYQSLHRRWTDGLQLGQNLDGLAAAKVKFIGCERPVVLPALLKEKWTKRVDVRCVFNRWARRVYPVLLLESAGLGLDNERYITPIEVTPPAP